MDNIIDYVEHTLQTMEELPFHDVDSLVLSQLTYLRFEAQVPGLEKGSASTKLKDLLQAEYFDSLFHNVRDVPSNRRLLVALAASPRFRNVKLNYYVNRLDSAQQKQFAAVTYRLEDNSAYLCFRGTDDTFIGWKEDFNMAFNSPIPSQQDAADYVNQVAAFIPGKLRVGGHSKGGNLAVYAGMMCDPAVQQRIAEVYSHDGPGFQDSVFERQDFQAIIGRVHKTLPQSSLVGMLLEHQENYTIVTSDRLGILQHDPFSWEIEDAQFHRAEKLTGSAQYMSKTLNAWIKGLSESQREAFADTLYQVLKASGAENFSQLSEEWRKEVPAMLSAVKTIDPDTRKYVLQTIKDLLMMPLKNLRAKES